tara:strand:+ start:1553 stop:1801 length:249 start_codon:yes stop_codon:yes gene_type:complete
MQVGRYSNPLTNAVDYEFRFAYTSMCDVVLFRMLKDHKLSLEEAVEKYNASIEKSKRQEVSERSERAFWKTRILAMMCAKWL